MKSNFSIGSRRSEAFEPATMLGATAEEATVLLDCLNDVNIFN